ncbi:aspartate aminotransferase family protein [Niabella drilacis]|uniref:Acetylornithine/succinyldiaminopimelate/putrescine aminotransferase n=1 Tax=Niabella drilacis (strain DSM 25811 / CCM 8410 / CCUG 62505 / LMG 26954 / E90) TaxID=1285928 RepID=A0A1G6NU88_NIADE|nr:aminotransferase class III-fold pyridoxal phosphate-dependent enzyme [Niabella drilacis]SDC70725.1 Acetylornithine/succinyldiaminopimelate/putrescine aminotransferase [Niabella drilacis]
MNQRELFLRHVAQTSAAPLALEISRARGCSIFDVNGKEYIDLIGGISVANTGHGHPAVIDAIKKQLDDYLHVMVYGEIVQSPQVRYARLLADHLPAGLHSVYFTNSGAEAVEGAMKLAKRYTGRTRIIAAKNSYHGSTQGALSILGDEYWRNAFRPLLPGIVHIDYNKYDWLDQIDTTTACVLLETVQAEGGILAPDKAWLQAVRQRCTETGALLILDEIQAGFGRTGKLWGFEHFDVVPDVLLLGKALGGGMPLGAFISNRKIMMTLTENPVLGHITTFGGHPVSCAAGHAALKVLLDEDLTQQVAQKEQLFRSLLHHPKIKEIRSFGLWMAVAFDSFETNKKIIDRLLEAGVFTDWFLFASTCFRICPPLTISEKEIETACSQISKVLETC